MKKSALSRRSLLALAAGSISASWGASRGRGEEPATELRKRLLPLRDQHGVPALGVGLIHGDAIHTAVVGVRKTGDPTPATDTDRFHLGSCTKSMTATLCGMLVDEGRLAWTSTLCELLGHWGETLHPEVRQVALEQLLSHRAGLNGSSDLSEFVAAKSLAALGLAPSVQQQRTAFVQRALQQKLLTEPGSKFAYSNRGYIIAGVVLEQLTGKPWEELIRARLFEPLGMKSAGFGAMGTPGAVDQPWQHVRRGTTLTPIEPGLWADNAPLLGPAGTVHCSLPDWAKYLQQHLRGERRPHLLSAATVAELQRDRGDRYALGWGLAERPWAGGRVLVHSGSNTLSWCVCWLGPARQRAVFAVCNLADKSAALACDEACAAALEVARSLS